MTGAGVERYATGISVVDQAARTWVDSSMLPAQFKDKDTGVARAGDVLVACLYLDALDMDPRVGLPDVYVVNGRPALLAEAQRALCRRAGIDLEVVTATADLATVAITVPGRPRREVTVTMDEAVTAGWTKDPKTGESMYTKLPHRMLTARACTHAISLYAPDVKRGMDAADPVQLPAEARIAIAPDGATIPPDRREPSIDPDDRAAIIADLAALPAFQREWFRRRWKDPPELGGLGCPTLSGTGQLSAAHGALAGYMLRDAQAAAALEVGNAEPTPAQVHDDAPESSDPEPGSERYDPDDAGRPF
jgi:hypothetical protein